MYNVYNHPHTFLIFLMFFSSNSENAYGTENTKKCSKVVYMYMEKMDMKQGFKTLAQNEY